ncbi:MAG: hypothetical protein IKE30_05765 [Clostridia bacterium]|nr:hypothetical protein [Clostridia bacterium]
MRRCLSAILITILCGVSAAAGAETGHALTRLFFSRWGEMKPRTFEVCWEENGCTIREDGGEPRPFAAELAAELAQAVADFDMEGWSGVYSTEYQVLDGEGFSLELEFADGTTVSASGDNAFPERYDEAENAMDAVFAREKMGAIAGTYRYEGEGFGGDFCITLNADGTCTFYEGPLSSCMGMGTWDTAYGAVYMREDDAGSGRSFMFGVGEDSLIWLAQGSDAFPCVSLPDAARFVRLKEPQAQRGAPAISSGFEDPFIDRYIIPIPRWGGIYTPADRVWNPCHAMLYLRCLDVKLQHPNSNNSQFAIVACIAAARMLLSCAFSASGSFAIVACFSCASPALVLRFALRAASQ